MIFDFQRILQKANRRFWIYLICVLLPFVLSPFAVSPHKESKCAFVLLLVGFYWLLEPAHVAATAFLPIILVPALGLMSSNEICNSYMTETFMMFIGGLIVAVAVEDCKLHERVALRVMLLIGTEFKWLMLGFMLTTMFLSMWINNMSTTAMMVPIVDAIIEEISKNGDDFEMENSGQVVIDGMEVYKVQNGTTSKRKMSSSDSKTWTGIKIALLLSVCYAANIGGTGSLTGCAPNMVLKTLIEDLYPESKEITFASWLMYNIPGMLLCVFIAWAYLWIVYIKRNKKILKVQSGRNIKRIIEKRYDELGPMTIHETEVLILFLFLIVLWVFRDPKFIPGWADSMSNIKIGDSFPAILVSFLLFFLPADPRDLGGRRILEWKTAQTRVPWGVIILLGGGFALADAAQKSGLSKMVGAQLTTLSILPPTVVVAVMCFITTMITEIMSNTATATILLPVINEVATSINVNPLYLMMPVTVVCSFAFMLPVATPANAVAFESGNMKTIDMAKPGLMMNLVCCSVQLLMINTLGVALFDLNSFPTWANKTENLISSATIDSLREVTDFMNSTSNSLFVTVIF